MTPQLRMFRLGTSCIHIAHTCLIFSSRPCPYLKPVLLTQAPALILSVSNLYISQAKACWLHSFKRFSGFLFAFRIKKKCLNIVYKSPHNLASTYLGPSAQNSQNLLLGSEGQVHQIPYSYLNVLSLSLASVSAHAIPTYSSCLNLGEGASVLLLECFLIILFLHFPIHLSITPQRL